MYGTNITLSPTLFIDVEPELANVFDSLSHPKIIFITSETRALESRTSFQEYQSARISNVIHNNIHNTGVFDSPYCPNELVMNDQYASENIIGVYVIARCSHF